MGGQEAANHDFRNTNSLVCIP